MPRKKAAKKSTRKKTRRKARARKATRGKTGESREVYEFDVHLLSGPIMEEFYHANPKVVRTLQMLGHQTLDDLHWAIFDAFDRDDAHIYEFQLGGKKPHDRKATRYAAPEAMAASLFEDETPMPKHADKARIDSLPLAEGEAFFYWFDYGDDWWHDCYLRAAGEPCDDGEYPRLVAAEGESPPQYPDWDDENEWDEDVWDEEDEWDEEGDAVLDDVLEVMREYDPTGPFGPCIHVPPGEPLPIPLNDETRAAILQHAQDLDPAVRQILWQGSDEDFYDLTVAQIHALLQALAPSLAQADLASVRGPLGQACWHLLSNLTHTQGG